MRAGHFKTSRDAGKVEMLGGGAIVIGKKIEKVESKVKVEVGEEKKEEG